MQHSIKDSGQFAKVTLLDNDVSQPFNVPISWTHICEAPYGRTRLTDAKAIFHHPWMDIQHVY